MLLLITERPIIAQTLTSHLHDNGIFFYRAPAETALLHYEKRDVGGVFLDCTLNPTQASALCHELRRRAPEMPIGVLVSKNDLPELPADLILRDGDLEALRDGILEFCRMCGWRSTTLRSYSVTVEPSGKIYYMGYRLLLSPHESMILRCLFYRYPRLTSADELMSLCFHDRLISIKNLFVHIATINRRASEIDPRPLIVNTYGKGYRLREGL